MRVELKEVIQLKLENFSIEKFNDKVKGDCNGFKIENPELKYNKGWLDGVCTALNLSYDQEGNKWVVRNGRKQIIAITDVDPEE